MAHLQWFPPARLSQSLCGETNNLVHMLHLGKVKSLGMEFHHRLLHPVSLACPNHIPPSKPMSHLPHSNPVMYKFIMGTVELVVVQFLPLMNWLNSCHQSSPLSLKLTHLSKLCHISKLSLHSHSINNHRQCILPK